MAKKEARQHVLMPKLKKLSEKEGKKVLEQYNLTIKELPAILSSDAALAGIEVSEGDIIMIERDSPTAGRTVFYRGVVNG
jgi:DNA-directed RNA polymerase subunit H